MNKEELLKNIALFAQKGELTKTEVLECFRDSENQNEKEEQSAVKQKAGYDFSNILYYLGGGVIFVGLVLFFAQYWATMNDFAKVLVTLGSGSAAFFSGVLFHERKNWQGVGNAFHLLAAFLLPLGMVVFFTVAQGVVTLLSASIILFVLFAGYFLTFFISRSALFLFLLVAFGSMLYFVFTSYLASFGVFTDETARDLLLYRVFFFGVAYLFFGYYFAKTSYALFSGLFYGLGSLGVLGAGFFLGGFSPEFNFWELIFPLLVFGGFFLSTFLKSRALLVFSALFFLAYIVKITTKYFTESVGWPLSLIFFGFVLVSTGYLVVRVNKRYFQESSLSQ